MITEKTIGENTIAERSILFAVLYQHCFLELPCGFSVCCTKSSIPSWFESSILFDLILLMSAPFSTSEFSMGCSSSSSCVRVILLVFMLDLDNSKNENQYLIA